MAEGKHAFLIMAHNQPDILKKLIGVLDDERNDLYIHLDAKAVDMTPEMFGGSVRRSETFWIKRRDIVWAGESQIRCELDLFREAAQKEYKYYHLISGVDFPIVSQKAMHSFFDEHSGYEFMEFWDRPEKEYLYRIRYRYPLQEQIGRYTNDPKTLSLRVRSKAQLMKQKAAGVDRVREYGKPVRCGANWVSVTDGFVRYLLASQGEIEKYFFQGVAADELYKQTLCWNSPFREKIWPGGHMRLIDWERGNPYTWRERDLEDILKSEAMFVRKVSGKDQLTDLLAERMKQKRTEGEKNAVS